MKSTAEALQVLKEQQSRNGSNLGVDLILKEHDPPHSNACRLLGRILEDEVLRTIPVVGERPTAYCTPVFLRIVGPGACSVGTAEKIFAGCASACQADVHVSRHFRWRRGCRAQAQTG